MEKNHLLEFESNLIYDCDSKTNCPEYGDGDVDVKLIESYSAFISPQNSRVSQMNNVQKEVLELFKKKE